MNTSKNALFVVILSLALSCCLAYNKVEDDDDFKSEQLIDNVIEDVMVGRKNDPQPFLAKRSSQGECNDHLKFPEASNIQTADNNKTIAALGSGPFCAPQKFPVTIPSDIHVNIFPNTVDLNRCLGFTYSSRTHCVATAKERVNVSYTMFLHSGGQRTEYVDLWEHTGCTPQCINQPKDCNQNQNFNQGTCGCDCTLPENHVCTDSKKHWHKTECKCICRIVEECSVYKEFNPNTCSCECAKCIVDMCNKHDTKELDSNTCQCVNKSG